MAPKIESAESIKKTANSINIIARAATRPEWKKWSFWLTLFFSFVAVVTSIVNLILLKTQIEESNRPYLTFDNLEKVDFTYTYGDDLKKFIDLEGNVDKFLENGGYEGFIRGTTSSFKLPLALVNKGKTPAKFKITTTNSYYPNVNWVIYKGFPEGYIFPDQKIEIGWFLEWNTATREYSNWLREQFKNGKSPLGEGLFVIVAVQYSPLNSQNENKYSTILKNEMVRSEDSKDGGKGRFTWKINQAF